MKIAEKIVEVLLDPDQTELSLGDPRELTTLSRSLSHHDPDLPGTPWDRILKRVQDRRRAEAERGREKAERDKYGAAMRPKAIYFSGAGYSGAGMHAVGGGGGLDTGHGAVG